MTRLFFSLYLVIFLSLAGYQAFGLAAQSLWMKDLLIHDNTNDFVGEMYLVEHLHRSLSETEFRSVLAGYPESSNVPLSLANYEDMPEQLQQLASTALNELQVHDPLGDAILHYKLPNSTLVASLGPLGTYEQITKIKDYYQISIFFVPAVSVFIWMLFLQRKLKGLERVAKRLGAGDLSVRVSEKGKDRVGDLNHSFNQMAVHLERLISSHKNLTNAVAHELRTPVARMRFQLDMMHEENDPKERREYEYGISKNINLLSDLVDELLTYARFDRLGLKIDLQVHSLHESLQRVTSSTCAKDKATVLYSENWLKQYPANKSILFEPKHLERAICNLVTNAQKYGESKVHLHVECSRTVCKIYVDDDGPGIPEQSRDDIFDAFRRLDDSRTRTTGGYGLGLAIVRQVARLHGGDVAVESSPLGGARFVFSWPIGPESRVNNVVAY